MPSVSVIIPVSRARDYVAATVSSLLKQTLDDLELVFVDGDGSDGSISLIHEITDSYSGPKKIVFTGDGKDDGPGVARNKGIDAATGDFITFTDSDDIVDPEYCQSLLDAALSCGADLAYCNICMDRTDSGKGRIKANPPVTGGPFLDSERRRFLVNFVSYFSTFLYRRSFLLENGIRFPHTRSSEDSAFLTSCLLSATAIVGVNKPLYHYIQRPYTLSNKIDPERYLQRIESFDWLLSSVKQRGIYPAYKQEIDFIYIKKAFLMACQTYARNVSRPDPAVFRQLCGMLDQAIPGNRTNSYLTRNIKFRFATWLVRRHPRLACRLLKIIR